MTNHWIDLKNSDCILMMGANPAENHPVSMRWVLEAREDHGATLISVDPRYTRSSAVADIYAPLRSGTDIAFLGGMIHYILANDLIHRDYVVHYTNASLLIDGRFKFDPAAGVFSGYDAAARKYDKSTWQYQFDPLVPAGGEPAEPKKDPTLRDPQCVYRLLEKHYARYDLAAVSGITGTPVEDLKKVYAAFAATGVVEKAGTIMYAMGWTQHTAGTQTIRAMAVIQLLLGNVGRAGGGVNALRGESNVQGSTDHGLLFHTLPGYLETPEASQPGLADYHVAHTPKTLDTLSANWWSNYAKYSVSFLKSMFGERATADNDFGYGWLPKRDDGADYSWLTIFDEMFRGRIKGFFVWGQNPACSGAHAGKVRKALTRLDWMVNVNLFPNETGWFWEDQDLLDELGCKAEDVRTEVFVLPAAVSVEKEGSVTNSGRWMQWRYRAADPPGDAQPDSQWMNLIFQELKKLYEADGPNAVFPEPIINLKWDYFDETAHPEGAIHALAKEINGRFLRDVKSPDQGKSFHKGDLVPGFACLKDDGSTSSGNWLYCGSYTGAGNMAARRQREPSGRIGLNSNWSWCWPANRRILYNRASVDLQGRPWDKKRPAIAFTGGVKDGKYVTKGWTGDVPDGGWYPMQNPDGTAREDARRAFIMKPDGLGQLFADALADGPLPEHYEPLESPLTANPLNGQMLNPASKRWDFAGIDKCSVCGSAEFPYVCSTYRVTEHWQTGVMTRHCPWLLELQPQLFVEMSHELAGEKGIKAGDQVRVRSARGAVTAIALPTARWKPFEIVEDSGGTKKARKIHQVGLPWCFGWKTPRDGTGGRSANLLTPNVGDANTMIPETKAFLVDIEKLDVKEHPEIAL